MRLCFRFHSVFPWSLRASSASPLIQASVNPTELLTALESLLAELLGSVWGGCDQKQKRTRKSVPHLPADMAHIEARREMEIGRPPAEGAAQSRHKRWWQGKR